MKSILRQLGLAATLGGALLSFASTTTYALSSSECSAAFKAAKANGTDGGVTYKVFRSTKCSAESGAAAVAPPAAAAAKPAQAAAPAADDAACRTAWDNWKAAGTRPKGMRYKAFQAGGCQVPAGGAAQAPAAPAPAPAAAAPKPVAPAAPAAATDTTKSGKPMSAGMAAFHEREVKCGAEWKQVKGTAAVPAGMKWPQFLSACNKRLKAQGQ